MNLYKFLLLSTMLILGFNLNAQHIITSQKKILDKKQTLQVNKVLSKYQKFTLEQRVLDDILNEKGNTSITLKVEEKNWVLDLYPSHLLGPSFRGIAMTDEGPIDLLEHMGVKTYKGGIRGVQNSQVVFTVNSYFINAFIHNNGEEYVLKTLRNITKSKEDIETYILYNLKDLIVEYSDPEETAANEKMMQAVDPNYPTNKRRSKEKKPESSLSKELDCPYGPLSTTTRTITSCDMAQIAAEADWEFVQDQGGGFWGAVMSLGMIISDIAAAEVAYTSGIDVSFQLTRILVYMGTTDNDPFSDNYSGATIASGNYNNEVRNIYAGISKSEVPRDFILLKSGFLDSSLWWTSNMSPTDFASLGSDGVGIMFTRANVYQPLNTGFVIGNIFGAPMTFGGFCSGPCASAPFTLMCHSGCGPRSMLLSWVDSTIIENFLATHGGFLQNSKVGEIDGVDFICNGTNEIFTLDLNHLNLNAPFTIPNITWSVGPGLSIINQNLVSCTITASPTFAGPSFVQANLPGITDCDVGIRKDILVHGMPPFECTNYTFCQEDLGIIEAFPLANTIVEQIDCISPNCPSIGYWVSPGNHTLFILPGAPFGAYTFEYTFSTPCGTFTNTLTVNIVVDGDECDGLIEKIIVPEEVEFELFNNEISQEQTLTFFPNPVSDFVKIKFQAPLDGITDLAIFNTLGKKVKVLIDNEFRMKGVHNLETDMSNLPNGTYFLNFNHNGHFQTSKLTKTN